MANKNTSYAVRLTLDGASSMMKGLTSVVGGFRGLKSGIQQAGADMFHFVNLGKDLFRMSQNAAGAVGKMTSALTAPNEQYEVSVQQFEQLLGGADAAKKRIKELYDYANATPFLNPDVLQAGKILQVFGKEALGSGKGLNLVGDMAAFAEVNMADMAETVGRVFSAIKGGRDWGEAAQRLQQMGLMTGEERNELEKMGEGTKSVTSKIKNLKDELEQLQNERGTKETRKRMRDIQEDIAWLSTKEIKGADPSAIWARFQGIMEKTTGSAARQGETFRGMKSTVEGLWDEMKRLTGEGLFNAMKGDLKEVRDELDAAFKAGRIQVFAEEAGKMIKNVYAELKEKGLGGVKLNTLMDAAEQGKLADLLGTIVKGAGQNFGIALRNFAVEYGPDVQRALIPAGMHRLLGINKDKDQALTDLAAGKPANMDNLTLAQQSRLRAEQMASEIYGTPAPDTQTFAKQQLMRQGMMPYIDIGEQVKGLGIQGTQVADAGGEASVEMQRFTSMASTARSLMDMAKASEDTNAQLERAAVAAGALADRLQSAGARM